MSQHDFVWMYVIPFVVILVIGVANEIRECDRGKITYESMTNSIALLIVGLLAFCLSQVFIISFYLK
jgi:hypothetical protein